MKKYPLNQTPLPTMNSTKLDTPEKVLNFVFSQEKREIKGIRDGR